MMPRGEVIGDSDDCRDLGSRPGYGHQRKDRDRRGSASFRETRGHPMLFLVAQTFFLLVVATVIGVAAGWLIWGGSKRSGTDTTSADMSTLTTELETARSDVEARGADVARLRRKLKRAVEELERHANQLEASEAQVALLSSGAGAAEMMSDPAAASAMAATNAELAELRAQLTQTQAAHASVTDELARLRSEHASVSDQLRFAEARAEALESELHDVRSLTSGDGERAAAAVRRAAELEHELDEAHTVIRDATARVTYLEQQALLWQNEADRLQAVLDDGSMAQAHHVEELNARLVSVQHEHEATAVELRMEASNHRLRADAAAEQLLRIQREVRGLQERSSAHLEATRTVMADLDRQLAATHSSLNDANPKPFASSGSVGATGDQTDARAMGNVAPASGLESLPGITAGLIDHLHELGVSSLADIARWSPDDVARISAWLPENPAVIAEHNWVEAARLLLAGSSGANAHQDRNGA